MELSLPIVDDLATHYIASRILIPKRVLKSMALEDDDFFCAAGDVGLILGTDHAFDLHPIECDQDPRSKIAFSKSQVIQRVLAIGAINTLRQSNAAVPLHSMEIEDCDTEF